MIHRATVPILSWQRWTTPLGEDVHITNTRFELRESKIQRNSTYRPESWLFDPYCTGQKIMEDIR
jgi:hypothetical protein